MDTPLTLIPTSELLHRFIALGSMTRVETPEEGREYDELRAEVDRRFPVPNSEGK